MPTCAHTPGAQAWANTGASQKQLSGTRSILAFQNRAVRATRKEIGSAGWEWTSSTVAVSPRSREP